MIILVSTFYDHHDYILSGMLYHQIQIIIIEVKTNSRVYPLLNKSTVPINTTFMSTLYAAQLRQPIENS